MISKALSITTRRLFKNSNLRSSTKSNSKRNKINNLSMVIVIVSHDEKTLLKIQQVKNLKNSKSNRSE